MREVQLSNHTRRNTVDSFHTSEVNNNFRELPTRRCPRLEKVNINSVKETLFMTYKRFRLGVRDDLTTKL